MTSRGEEGLLGRMRTLFAAAIALDLKVQDDGIEHERYSTERENVGWLKREAKEIGHDFSPSGAKYRANPNVTSPPATEPQVTALC